MPENKGWEPIRIYSYLGEADGGKLTRDEIDRLLQATDPDKVAAAGDAFITAMELVGPPDGAGGDEEGLQAALTRAATELAKVWRDDGATTAQNTLRALHATAGAIGDAMMRTGAPLSGYAHTLRQYRSTMPSNATPEKTGEVGGTTGDPETNTPPTPDEAARAHLKALNAEIITYNGQLSEGLAFDFPVIEPIEVTTDKAPNIDPSGSSDVPTGRDGTWQAGNDGTGSPTGGNPTGEQKPGGTPGDQKPGDQTPGDDTPGQDRPGEDKPGEDRPGDDQPGDDKPGDDKPGEDTPGDDRPGEQKPEDQAPDNPGDQKPGQDPESVPPVIGANPETELSDFQNNPTGTPPTTTTPTPTPTPTPSNPTTTGNPFTPNGVITNGQPPGTGYGTGATGGAGASPAVLRGGTPGTGTGFMPFMPGAAGGENGSGERERDIYDPEGDVWSVPHPTSPTKIG
ncbi:hypothetical protein ACIBEJ_16285 [Nonomuraea sp. NPDC050790]|uniref:hypothetical protein n=1 Tax=Nonomuraea sp. NPDC050790 TaxID=3364371 RepID=UPI0037A0FDB5